MLTQENKELVALPATEVLERYEDDILKAIGRHLAGLETLRPLEIATRSVALRREVQQITKRYRQEVKAAAAASLDDAFAINAITELDRG